MKKLISVIISFVLMFCIPLNAFAASEPDYIDDSGISPCYSYTQSIKSLLAISNRTATCTSSVIGYSGTTTKIEVTKTLQKKNGTLWETYAYWSKTYNTWECTYKSTISNLTSGTYRLKTTAKVYKGNSYETITHYSTLSSC